MLPCALPFDGIGRVEACDRSSEPSSATAAFHQEAAAAAAAAFCSFCGRYQAIFGSFCLPVVWGFRKKNSRKPPFESFRRGYNSSSYDVIVV